LKIFQNSLQNQSFFFFFENEEAYIKQFCDLICAMAKFLCVFRTQHHTSIGMFKLSLPQHINPLFFYAYMYIRLPCSWSSYVTCFDVKCSFQHYIYAVFTSDITQRDISCLIGYRELFGISECEDDELSFLLFLL
jgi:hypothetical protein